MFIIPKKRGYLDQDNSLFPKLKNADSSSGYESTNSSSSSSLILVLGWP